MKWQQLILAFISTICLIFAGNALAQTDININNTNLVRFGGSVSVPENQTVENASAFGGSVTVLPNARVLDTAIAFGGDVILKAGARVDGDAYSFGGKIIQEPGAIFAILFGTVFLAITLIGIPLIPLLSLSAVVTSLVGSLGVALFVGQRLNKNDHQPASQQFLIGLAILTVLALIPFLGGLVVFLMNLFGLGVILLWKFGRAEHQMTT